MPKLFGMPTFIADERSPTIFPGGERSGETIFSSGEDSRERGSPGDGAAISDDVPGVATKLCGPGAATDMWSIMVR